MFAISQLLTQPAGITGGSVMFRGREMAQMSDKQLRHVRWRDFSVVMQSAMNALNPVMTIGQQMRDACKAHSAMSKEEIAERSAEVLRLVSIDPVHLDSYPHQLSGGMRQRGMIAMALLFTPDLVIMDEPTSALDVVAQRSLMRQIKELQDRLGFATIFVTHDISLVGNFSDRLLVMYAGQVAELGATSTLFGTPRHPYARALLEAFPSVRGPKVPLTGIAGAPPNLAAPPPGCRFQPRCADAMPECSMVQPPLYRHGGLGGPVPAVQGRAGAGPAPSPAGRHVSPNAAPTVAGARPDHAPARPEPVPLLEVVRRFPGTSACAASGRRRHCTRSTTSASPSGAARSSRSSARAAAARAPSPGCWPWCIAPDSGEIRFEGKPISALRWRGGRLAYRGDVPMVFQDPYSVDQPRVPGLARDHAGDRAAPAGPRRPDQRAEAIRVMEAVGLSPRRRCCPSIPTS